jgi:signal transduction histidine kinase
MLRRLIGEDIDLLWKPCKDLWPVKMDPAQIDQILANLMVNSRDAITGVGKITIETGKVEFDEHYCEAHVGFVPGRYVLLAVSDDGCGMNKETLAQLFEPFFTTKEVGRGTGLGVATIYGIVKQNNGFINVYSEPGQGTTFKIYLPRQEPREAATEQPRKPAEVPTGTETVLLVEDEKSLLKFARMLLEELGYTVLAAGIY